VINILIVTAGSVEKDGRSVFTIYRDIIGNPRSTAAMNAAQHISARNSPICGLKYEKNRTVSETGTDCPDFILQ